MRIEILGTDRTSVLAAATLNVTRISKERRTCSLDIFSAASSWIPNIGQDLKIYDDDDALIFGGCIAQVRTEEYHSGNSDETVLQTGIFSNGYNQIAQRRASVASYTTSFAGTIVEALRAGVLCSTSYNEGITAGTIDNGAYYEVFKKEYALVSDLFNDLAQASGFKWYIDDAKALHFTQESSTPDAAHELMSTGSFRDYHDFMVSKSIDNYRNHQIVIGDTDSTSGLTVSASAISTSQVAAQQAIEGGSSFSSGLYTHVIRDMNIKTTADAETAAVNALKQYGYPGQISFKSYSTDWDPSTKLRVKLPKYGIDTDTYYLIEEVTYQKITANELVATITASKRDPFNFSSQKNEDAIDYMRDVVKTKTDLFDFNATIETVIVGTFPYLTPYDEPDWLLYLNPYEAEVIATSEHDTGQGITNSLVKIDDTHFMLAYVQTTGGNLKTFSVDSNYAITEIDVLQYDASASRGSLALMDATHFVVAYTGSGSDGYVATYSIDALYDTITVIDSLEHDTAQGTYPQVVKLDATHFVVAYTSSSGVGKIKVFSVDASFGTITEVHVLQHDAGATAYNAMVAIDSTHVMLTYYSLTGGTNYSFVKTFTVDGSFNIAETDSLTMAVYEEDERAITQIDATHYAVACTGASGTARLRSILIDGSYQMSLLDTMTMSNATAWMQSMVKFDNTHLVNATYLSGPGAASLNILQLDFTYALAQKSSVVYDSTRGIGASIVKLDDSHVVVAYGGADNDGFIKVLEVATR